ncbi:TIGR01459 family HAD-type hydrolase [Bosea sp. TWI1241]|uniref:TIGR01459 family HAD-type hydrolase n=1 Tax=Bosea sp. TWI1241 TaxID=3148904 RepID=UPI00320B69FC
MTASTRLLSGVAPIVGQTELCLCDIWGVVHNGVEPYRSSCEALAMMRAGGTTVVLVSNAPRPRSEVAVHLGKLGVPGDAFDAIVTSGDVARDLIAQRAGEPLYHLGPERDLPLFAGLDAPRVGPEEARYVVCSGLFDDETETAADYADRLAGFARRDLTMICANPDLMVDRGGRMVPCAGSLAAAYEALGGRAIYAGKPHAPIYELAIRIGQEIRGEVVERARMLAVGDAIRTDVAGAARFGLPALMCLAGIHAEATLALDEPALQAWLATQSHQPDYAIAQLAW